MVYNLVCENIHVYTMKMTVSVCLCIYKHSHMQTFLRLGSLLLGAVADDSVAVGQVEVECDQRTVLHTQGPQGGAINLEGERWGHGSNRTAGAVSNGMRACVTQTGRSYLRCEILENEPIGSP